jgi:hypothetical protein
MPRAPSSTGLYTGAAAFMARVHAADAYAANRVVVALSLSSPLPRTTLYFLQADNFGTYYDANLWDKSMILLRRPKTTSLASLE